MTIWNTEIIVQNKHTKSQRRKANLRCAHVSWNSETKESIIILEKISDVTYQKRYVKSVFVYLQVLVKP